MKLLKITTVTAFGLMFLIAMLLPANHVSLAANVSTGEDLYKTSCKMCHGADGKGNLKLAETLKIDAAKLDLTKKESVDKSDDDLKLIITNGVGKMPKYKEKLSEQDIAATLQYLRTLQK